MIIKEPSLLKVIITFIYGDNKNIIYIDIYIKKGMLLLLLFLLHTACEGIWSLYLFILHIVKAQET